MAICLEQGADLHMAQLMPPPLAVSCFSKIQTDCTFSVPAHPGSPRQRTVKKGVYVLLLIMKLVQYRGNTNKCTRKCIYIRQQRVHLNRYDTIRYDTRCYSNVRSKAGMSRLNLRTETTTKTCKTEKLKSKSRYAQK